MKKLVGTTLIALMVTGTMATAQEIAPVDTTASSQASPLPIIGTLPAGAVIAGGFVILAGVVIGVASDGT